MRLDRVTIKNFRSIKDLTIDFNPSFKILVGKNESGKSNIIRALSLLSKDYEPTIDDKREFLPDEKVEEDYYVRFIFKLDDAEIKEIHKSILEETSIKHTTKIIKFLSMEFTLYEYLKEVASEGIYKVNIETKAREFVYWKIGSYYKYLPYIKKHKAYAKKLPGDTISMTNSLVLNQNDFKNLKEEDFITPPISELNDLIGQNIVKIVQNNIPNLILWKYDEVNLLPNRINILNFTANPEICKPLKILFNFVGYTNIENVINEALHATGNQFDNLLSRISKKATKHFKEVWKEYPNISFSFTHNGDNIIAAIQEENKYPFIQRSDGFKRFVTFLILISACAKTRDLDNTILLFDEPDISLHPSGIRYLRDELIKISKNNFIVVATHSIFMIDNDCINRHYIVSKKKEQTLIKTPDGDELIEEEILYKAVGYSLYEILKIKNIIFEGWRDKQLFKVALDHCPTRYKKFKKDFSAIGICQSNGVKGMKGLTPIFEATCRKCLIITDDDEPARQRQTEYESIRGFGTWKTYKEIDTACNAITGEDFLKKEYINEKVKLLKKGNSELTGDPSTLPNNKGILNSIKEWLMNVNHKTADEAKKLNSQLKDLIFEDLTQKNIDVSYYSFLEKVMEQIDLL